MHYLDLNITFSAPSGCLFFFSEVAFSRCGNHLYVFVCLCVCVCVCVFVCVCVCVCVCMHVQTDTQILYVPYVAGFTWALWPLVLSSLPSSSSFGGSSPLLREGKTIDVQTIQQARSHILHK